MNKGIELEPFNFKQWTVVAVPGRYPNMRKAIRLIDAADGSLVAIATVNVPSAELSVNEVLIKDYSENEGMLDSMITAGYIEDAYGLVKIGFVVAHRCRLTEKGMALFEYHVAEYMKDE